jgi:hypothetical protein
MPRTRRTAFSLISQVLAARGELSAQDRKRMSEVARLFGVGEDATTASNLTIVPSTRKEVQAQAS